MVVCPDQCRISGQGDVVEIASGEDIASGRGTARGSGGWGLRLWRAQVDCLNHNPGRASDVVAVSTVGGRN